LIRRPFTDFNRCLSFPVTGSEEKRPAGVFVNGLNNNSNCQRLRQPIVINGYTPGQDVRDR